MFQPVSDFIPEFRNMKVAHRMLNGDVEIVPAMRPIRIQDLFTMTGGLSYDLDSPAIRRIRRETDGAVPDTCHSEGNCGRATSVEPEHTGIIACVMMSLAR